MCESESESKREQDVEEQLLSKCDHVEWPLVLSKHVNISVVSIRAPSKEIASGTRQSQCVHVILWRLTKGKRAD